MNVMFFMTAAAIFITVFFIAIAVIVSHVKTWATKRDKYYEEYFKLLNEKIDRRDAKIMEVLSKIELQIK